MKRFFTELFIIIKAIWDIITQKNFDDSNWDGGIQ